MKSLYTTFMIIAAALVPAGTGCSGGGDVPTTPSRTRVPVQAAPPQASAAAAQAAALPAEAQPSPEEAGELIVHKLTEESFIESPSRRDPFRSFLIPLTKQHAVTTGPQIASILDQYQLDELKLVAIVSGSGAQAGAPMAMVEDPVGVGHIIRRGNYVGKGETVRKVSSGEEVQIFWKVARIREDAIVFEREDPFSATEATVTKILELEST
jgi:Tfp pilus assembly protein PilP